MTQSIITLTTAICLTTLTCTPSLADNAAIAPTFKDTLNQVMSSKKLRVCSPGDYKPFSFDNKGQFEGIDNDLVTGLAKSLGVDVVMVKTTWSNLMGDLTADKCDIAVGGISITLPRQQQALFSNPYFVNGKTPLVRCSDVKKYQTIDQINRPTVRIVANPGGSNESFAKTTLSNANLTMQKDNLVIFDEVAKNHADVFVTEAAEARVKQHEYKGVLCAVNPDKPLKPAENGWLIPNNDFRFKAYVDQYLYLEKLSGNLDKTIDKWVPKN